MDNNQLLDFDEKSLNMLFTNSLQPMWITNPEVSIYLLVNEASAALYGFPIDEIVLQSVEKVLLNKQCLKLKKLFGNDLSSSKINKTEISIIHKNGRLLFADVVAANIMFCGQPAALFTLTDVTEKKNYRNLLEEAIELEGKLKVRNQQLKELAYFNFHLARKPLANILGLVNVLDQTTIADQTLLEAIEFLRESGNELDQLIKGIDPQQY